MCDREGAIWRRLVISRRRACGLQKLRDGLAMFIQGWFTRLLHTIAPQSTVPMDRRREEVFAAVLSRQQRHSLTKSTLRILLALQVCNFLLSLRIGCCWPDFCSRECPTSWPACRYPTAWWWMPRVGRIDSTSWAAIRSIIEERGVYHG